MKNNMLKCLMIAAVFATSAALGALWYVDDDNYRADCETFAEYEAVGLDGTSANSAFGTIQAAVDKASSGDEVLVLPGTYDKGGKTGGDWNGSRVNIGKRLRIRSTGGKDVTHIVGAPDPVTQGIGDGAMRCLVLTSSAGQAVVEGFTLRDGYSGTGSSLPGRGGACFSNGTASYLVDCVISNSVSSYSVVFQVNCVRCEIVGNRDGGASRPHVYNSILVNCLVRDNGYTGTLLWDCKVYNSTVANSHCSISVRATSHLYNSIIECPAQFYEVVGPTNSLHDTKALLAPAADNYRPAYDSSACLGGDATWLADLAPPSGIDLYRDLSGVPFATSGPIHMGCYQACGARAGGRINLSGSYAIDGGNPHNCSSYVYAETYPTQFMVTTGSAARPVYGSISGVTYGLRPPDLNDAIAVMPPKQGEAVTFSITEADAELWVSMSGDDDTGDGSQNSPYRSIQRAVDAADATNKTIVNVGSGIYGVGEAHNPRDLLGNEITMYGKASVTVYDKCVRIAATDGAEHTVIHGTFDPDYADDVTLPNCGPKAARCVLLAGASNKGASVSGFTLTGGATDRTEENYFSWGGGYLCPSSYNAITDCIVSNNAATYCAGGYAGTVQRCLFTGNKGSYGTAGGGWNSVIFGCVFVNNPSSRNIYGAIYNDTYVYHCTLIGEGESYVYAHNTSVMRFANSIVVGGNQDCVNMKRCGNVIWGGVNPDRRPDEIYADPLFADAEGGDYRIKSISCAVGAGCMSADYYSGYSTTGYDGRRIVVTRGAPLPGAVQELVACGAEAYFMADNGGFAVAGGALGYNDLLQTGALTLSPATGTRPCFGYLVNGVTNLFSDLIGGTLTIDAAAAAAAGGVNVVALYDEANWYVDADAGNDANPGCAAYPLKTLAGGMRNAVSGDIVHAAPGDYNQGLMIQDESYVISSRVVVAEGVTLLADGGPDNTFITGADSPAPKYTSGVYKGAGPGAVRCVFLRKNSKVRGFTLRGGRFNGMSDFNSDGHSGGILGINATLSVAENCVITNCCGWRGGATFGVLAANCRIVGCSSASGSAGRSSSFIGCLFGGGCNNAYVAYPSGIGVYNCTFSGSAAVNEALNADSPVCNSIVLGTLVATEARPAILRNCLVAAESISEGVAPFVTLENCDVRPQAEIVFNPDFTLPFGSPAIDSGSNLLVRAEHQGVDAAGNPRISNGRVDIGAFEYDWRPDYANAICPNICSVESATPETELKDGKVAVKGLLATTFRITGSERNTRYSIPVSVTGGGTLTVYLNGSLLASLEAGDHVLTFRNDLPENKLDFIYESAPDDAGVAAIGRANVVGPGSVLAIK